MTRSLLVAILTAHLSWAQATASLRGLVKDEQDRPVAEARVRLFRQDTISSVNVLTDTTGQFKLHGLVPGPVVLQIDKAGFRSVSRTLVLTSGAENSLEITLEVAGVMESVFVTATATPQSVDEISKASNVVSAEEMEARSEYSISEALRTVPGVLVLNSGGPGQVTTIRVRGLRPDATAVLIDGLRFRDASTPQSDASWFISSLNLVGADRVEVVRGSGSSLYGTNAVGGVINIITHEGGSPLHGNLLVEGGTMGFWRGRGSIGGGLKENRLRYSGSLLHLNVTEGVDGNDAARSNGGQGFLRFDFTPTLSVSSRFWGSDDFVQANIFPTTVGIPASNFPADGVIPASVLSPANVRVLEAGGRPDYTGVTLIPGRDDPDSRRSSRFSTTALTLRHTLTPRVNWQAIYQSVRTSRVFQNGPAGTGFQPEAENYGKYVGHIDTVDLRGNAVLTPWLTFSGGYEFERERYLDRQNNNLPPPRTVVSQTKVNQDASTLYFAAQISASQRRLQVSLSGRRQSFRLYRPSFQLTGTANNYDRVPLPNPPEALTGDVAISYLLAASNTKLRVHAGNTYRAPSLFERFGGGFSSDPVTGVVIFSPYGDPRLSPDRYNSVDAGFDQYLFRNRVRLAATCFYSRVVSITAFDSSGGIRPDTDPYGRSLGYINGSGGISRGFELGIEARPNSRLLLSGAYTYTNPNLDRDITVRGFWRVLHVPRHVASFVVTQRWTGRLETSVDLFHYSSYFNSYFAVNRARAFQFPGFTKADFAASFTLLNEGPRRLRLHGQVENVLNQRYYHLGWLAPGASFRSGLTILF